MAIYLLDSLLQEMFMTVAHFYKFVKIHKKNGVPSQTSPPQHLELLITNIFAAVLLPGLLLQELLVHFYKKMKFLKIHTKMGSPLTPAPPTLRITHNECL